jgi:hypothetical protein
MLPYASMRARSAEAVAAVAAALLLTALMTWPVAPRMADAARLDSGDGMQSVWNIAWVARTIVEDPWGLFDANIYHPHRQTLTYLEPNIFTGLLAVPAYWTTRNPVLAHNVVLLLGFVLAFLGAYALVRHLTGHRGAAAVAAVSFAFCPYMFTHLPHIQLLMTGGLPFALLAMHRFVERRTPWRAAALGLVVAAEALSCGYYGVFLALVLAPGLIYYAVARRVWREPSYWIWTGLAATLAVGLVLPFLWPVLRLQQTTGFVRDLAESARWAANPGSYLASPAHLHRWMLPLIGGGWVEALFPGFVASALALTGLWLGWSRRWAGLPREHLVFYSALGVLAGWASFGPAGGLYAALYRVVPVFSLLHAPSRLGLLVVLASSVMGGFAVAWMAGTGRRGVLIAGGILALTLADLAVMPVRVETRPLPATYEWLVKSPPGAVAEFPFFYRRVDFHRHALYMYYSTYHWRPIVNGYTDYIPPDFREMVIPVSSFPNPESFAILKRLRVRYVIFHLDLYDHLAVIDLKARIEQYREYLRPIRLEDPVWLFEIAAWPPER